LKKLMLGACALAVGVGGMFSVSTAGAEPHEPVVVCHWVPAAPAGAHPTPGPEGGSYLVIVVDDDGANGNKNLQAHEGHEHDIIPGGDRCKKGSEDPKNPKE
jgi:hypothetical protein